MILLDVITALLGLALLARGFWNINQGRLFRTRCPILAINLLFILGGLCTALSPLTAGITLHPGALLINAAVMGLTIFGRRKIDRGVIRSGSNAM